MDLRALDDPQPLEVSSIDDIHVLAGWEHWLKLSFSTPDLHITRGWSLVSRATEVAFEAHARALRGPVVYSFLDADSLPEPEALEMALKGKRFACNWTQIAFPTGALEAPRAFAASPAGSFRVLLCKLATGSTLPHHEAEGEGDFFTREIPAAYSSLALVESSPATNESKQASL
ncbi:hypothetical protein ETH_00011490 [Eimeria tenella]|uniref:Uncharacterized protein n=1 Tax=Eimeria tenella TaxID=5802 RepID=U6KXQ8_EIMTE|nr:hypothetical protein ETH_00011490 [Eimeria tenella]CDJ41733.1 hypothetical protein ETH_00011490 [Eimeria tenella]|eukprot:XP_013232483.1 hypothetical protein ETH_00011490 [Eimeria tenella]